MVLIELTIKYLKTKSTSTQYTNTNNVTYY